MSIHEKLRLIREGVLILEADDDKYDLPPDDGGGAAPTDPPAADATPADPVGDTGDDPTKDNTDDSADDAGTDYSADDNTPDEGDGSDPSNSGDDSSQPTDDVQEPQPIPGEIIPLDDVSRKLLTYKNFRKYRELRDSVVSMLTELTEAPTVSDDQKQIISICIEQASQLVGKLDDYILYRYKNNSYEVNYRNFMDFVVEKKLIEKILSEMQQGQA